MKAKWLRNLDRTVLRGHPLDNTRKEPGKDLRANKQIHHHAKCHSVQRVMSTKITASEQTLGLKVRKDPNRWE